MAAMDDDFDLMMDDLDFDFDGSTKKSGKPKNIVFSTGLDIAQGVKESLDPRDKIRDILRETMPSAVRSEYADLENAMDSIKDEIDKNVDDVKNVLKDVSGIVGDLLPEGKIKSKLKDFAKKEGYEDTGWKKTKEEEENEKIKHALLEALGENNEQERQASMLKEALEEKREASSQLVLKHIYAELKVSNSFNTNLTSKYYNKNLELQYRQLYKLSELVELTKVGWESNRKQIEAVIINSALPDLIKLKTLQATNDRRLAARARTSYMGNYFKKFNPFENLTNNIKANIRNNAQGFKSGLEAMMMGAGTIKDMKDNGMGMGPGLMIGSMLGDFIRSNTLGYIGDRLGKTSQGKRFIYNFKDAMADPRLFFQGLRDKEDGKSTFSKIKRRLFGSVASLTGTPSKDKAMFVNENLDDVKAFDGRAHQALVKVIPGLLGNIYGAIKAGLKVKDEDIKRNMLYFDNKTGGFVNREGLVRNLNREMKSALNKDGYKRSLEMLFRAYNGGYGAKDIFSEAEKRKISAGLASYLMEPYSSGINTRALTSKEFLDKFSGKLRDKLQSLGAQLQIRSREDNWVQEEVIGALKSARESLPNMNKRLEDLHKSGQLDVARGMKLVKQDGYGRYTVNDKGVDRKIQATAGAIDFGTEEEEKKQESMMEKAWNYVKDLGSDFGVNIENSRVVQGYRGFRDRVSGGIKGVKDRVNKGIDKFASKAGLDKSDAEFDQMMSNLPSNVKSQVSSAYNTAQKTVDNTMKDIDKQLSEIDGMPEQGVFGTVKEQASDTYLSAKKDIAKAKKALMSDIQSSGGNTKRIQTKLKNFEKRVKDIKNKAIKRVKSDPRYKVAMDNKATASDMDNDQGMVSKDGLGFGGVGVMANMSTIGSGSKYLFKQKAKEEIEEMRENSYTNREKKWSKELEEEDKGRPKGSMFSAKTVMKGLAIGGAGLLAVSLLRKLGFGMEDLVAFGKGMFEGLSTFAGATMSVLSGIGSTLKSILGFVGPIAGWIGDKIGGAYNGIKDFFGWGNNDQAEGGDQSGGKYTEGSNMAGKVAGFAAGGALLYGGQKMIRRAWNSGPMTIARGLVSGTASFAKNMLTGKGFFESIKRSGEAYSRSRNRQGWTNRLLDKPKEGLTKLATKASNAARNKSAEIAAKTAGRQFSKLPNPNDGVSAFQRLRTWVSKKFGWAGKKITGLLDGVKDKAIKLLGRLNSAWSTAVNKFRFLTNVIKKPKVIARVGANVIKKFAVRLGAIALAATGVGAIITAAMGFWDLFWVLKYWLWDDMTFWGAVCKQYLGVDLFDPNEQKALEISESDTVAKDVDKIVEQEKKKEEKKLEKETIQKEEPAITPPKSDPYSSYGGEISVDENGYVVFKKNGQTLVMDPKNNYNVISFDKGTGGTKVAYTVPDSGIQNPNTSRVKPNFDFSKYKAPTKFSFDGIGSVSGWFESRGKPGIVSSGVGDYGGASYGVWQMSSKEGTVQAYLKSSKYRNEFAGLPVNSPEFKAKWQQLGIVDPVGFQKDQEAYIKRTHYDPCVKTVKSEIGLDIDKRSDALKAAVFSASVHYGPGKAATLIRAALNNKGLDPATATDEEIINAIYDYKLITVDSKFRSSSYNVREGIKKRAVQEKNLVLSLLSTMPKTNTPSTTTTAPSGQQDSSPITTVSYQEPTTVPSVTSTSTPSSSLKSVSVEDRSSSISTQVGTSTIQSFKPIQDILSKQLVVQQEMLKSLVQIASNTAVLGTIQNKQQEQPQSSFIPQPVISLERKERFDI